MESPTGTPRLATVGLEPFEVTMDYNSFWWTLVIISVIVIILLVIFFIWAYVYHRSQRQLIVVQTPADPIGSDSPINVTFGPSSHPGMTLGDKYKYLHDGNKFADQATCERSTTRFWDTSVGCRCLAPFWGTGCERESYKESYYALGTISKEDEESIALDVIEETSADRLSLPFVGQPAEEQTTCTDLCDANLDCSSILWQPAGPDGSMGTCFLLGDHPQIKPGGELTFHPDVEPNLFAKRNSGQSRPSVGGRVFLFQQGIPDRFWLLNRKFSPGNNVVNMVPLQLYHIHFYPTSLINDDRMIIVFRDTMFTVDEAIQAATRNGGSLDGYYIFNPRQSNILAVPQKWGHSEIFAVVIPASGGNFFG